MRIGIYPGTFDPPTKGHMDLVIRSALLVDRLVVGVATNAGKGPMFTAAERTAMVQKELARLDKEDPSLQLVARVQVVQFADLLVEFARKHNASVIFRGLRAVSDFEYEFQMAGMNRNLNAAIETVFLMASDKHQFVSSRFVKEICRLSGDVSPFVSADVLALLKGKIAAGVEPNIEPRLAGTDPP
jgi:pantetheine-phosphate adenylyltransferase